MRSPSTFRSSPVRRVRAVLVALMAAGAVASPTAHAAPEAARSADGLVDTIAVATHLRFEGTPYDRRFYDGFASGRPGLYARLQELGIRHIRDEMPGQFTGFRDTVLRRHADLGNRGIRTTMIFDPALGVGAFPSKRECYPGRTCHTVDTELRRIRRFQQADAARKGVKPRAMAIEAIEGPNETDGRGWSFGGVGFPRGTVAYARDLYRAVKGHPDRTFRALPVIAPSVAVPEQVDRLGDLSPSCDLGNMHSYPAGGTPTFRLDAGLRGRADGAGHIELARSGCRGKPVVATETGYLYGTDDPVTGHPHVTERAGAKYTLRMIFEYARRGVQRTTLYELLDSSPQRFGLLTDDGRPRQAFHAVRNLTTLLADPGNAFVPESLDLTVTGPPTVHRMLLQRRDGSFWLALWNDVPSTTAGFLGNGVVDRDSTAEVRIALPADVQQAQVYRPSERIEPIATHERPVALALTVPDDVLLVRIRVPRKVTVAPKAAKGCHRPARKASSRARRDRSAAAVLACRLGR